MKRSILRLALGAMVISTYISFTACSGMDSANEAQGTATTPETNYDDRMEIPLKDLTCYNGGPNSTSCKIEPGIKIGDMVSIGCGVTCEEGYYACCGVRCACKPDDMK